MRFSVWNAKVIRWYGMKIYEWLRWMEKMRISTKIQPNNNHVWSKIPNFRKIEDHWNQQEKSDDTALTSNIFEINRTQKIKKRGDDFLFFNHIKKQRLFEQKKSLIYGKGK